MLTCQPNNAKALYRKCRILSAMGRTSEALAAARAAAAAAPADPAAKRELRNCEARAGVEHDQERRLARRMLGADAPPKPDKKPSTSKVSRLTIGTIWNPIKV